MFLLLPHNSTQIPPGYRPIIRSSYGLGIAFLGVMVLHGVVFALLQSLNRRFPDSNFLPLWQISGGVILVLVTLLTFVLIDKLLPDAQISWKDVWIGARKDNFVYNRPVPAGHLRDGKQY